MRNLKAGNLSAMISLVITGAYLVSVIVSTLVFQQEFHLLFLFFSACLLFFISFFVIRYALEKFIYEKIKPIYKTILSLKSPKGKEYKPADLGGDILSSVNTQVIKWAEDKKEEIEELKKLEIYRREFLGNVSHELKSPVFNIQGYVLTLLDGGIDDPKINREYLVRTEKSVTRLINIVEDLEAISKMESGEFKLSFQRFDMIALVEEVFESLEMLAEKKNIELIFDKVYEKPVFVNADRENIRQVLINLIDNSIKYGNKRGSTRVSFFDMDENILIEVTDDGIGVSQHDIPRLFERFYRTDKGRSREFGGTGLGLAIVKHIIEAHRQTINVRSTIGIGTAFAFTLNKG